MHSLTNLSRPDHLLIDGSYFLSAGRDADLALIADDGRALTYRQLREQSSILRERFGVGKKLVLIIARNDPDTVLAYVSALDAGHAVVVISPEPASLIDHVCEHFSPNFICTHDQSEWRVVERHADQLVLHPELACLLSTSGTTGEGKFVRLSYKNLVCNALSIAEYLEIDERDRFLLNLPINYSYGLSILNSHLVAGARLLLTERSVTDSELWRFFRSNEGTGFAGVPHTYKLLEALKFDGSDLPSLRTITQAGGRLPVPLARRFANWAAERGVRFFIMYGQTEASPRIAYLPPSLAATYPDCIGRPISGGVLELVDAEGTKITTIETEGELQYTGPNVMMGYATRLSDLALDPGPNVLRTGDVAVLNSEGLFRITGRQNRFLKIYGLRISLEEIERKLEACSIKAICGGNDEFLGVMTTEDQATDTHLIDQVAQISGLPPAVVALLRVHEFPVLQSGKIDYRSISQQLLKSRSAMSRPQLTDAPSVDHVQAPFVSRIEKVFSENFPSKLIGATDSFVSLGGDSLSYVTVSLALEEFIPKLPVHWETLTAKELDMLASQSVDDVRRAGNVRSVESTIVIRAVAPVLIAMHHIGLEVVAGGAALLLVVAGMNFCRFQLPQLIKGRAREVLWGFIQSVLLPYWIVVVGYGVWKGEMNIPDIMLYANMDMELPTWVPFPTGFIQVLAQLFLLLSLLLLSRRVRQVAAKDLYQFGLVLVLISAGARALEPVMFPGLMINLHGELPWVAWLFALGLAIAGAENRKQRAFLSLLAVALPPLLFLEPDFSRPIIISVGCLLAIWVPRINVPTIVGSLVGILASASLFVYMLHIYGLRNSYTSDWPVDMLRLLTGIGLGVGAWWCYGIMQNVVKRYLGQLRSRGELVASQIR
jgi:acyl-CoA synthetase (AMP-forming)/AMP-acid ligase II